MTAGAKIRLRRIGLAIAVLALITAAAALIVAGTESGTRWVLQRVAALVPGRLELAEFHGTLLRGLDIPELRYETRDFRITALELELELDWLRSSLDRVVLERLAADSFEYRSLAEPEPGPKPFRLSMPALPLRLGTAELAVGTLAIDGLTFSGVGATALHLRGQTLSAGSAEASIAGVSAALRDFSITLTGDVATRGEARWHSGDWSGEARLGGSLRELEVEHVLAGRWPARTQGTVALIGRTEPLVDAVTRIARWQFGDWTVSDGELRLAGTADDYRTAFAAEVADGRTLSASIEGSSRGDRQGLRELAVVADGPAGQVGATGTLAWLPGFAAELELSARNIDPAVLAPLPAGRIDAELRLEAAGPDAFHADLRSLSGTWNDAAVSAHGRLTRSGALWRCADCELAAGGNRIVLSAALEGRSLSAELAVDAPALRQLSPAIAGSLQAKGRLGGTLDRPSLSGTASARQLAWGVWQAATLTVESRSSTLERLHLELRASGLARGEVAYGDLAVQLDGGLDALEVTLAGQRGALRASIDATVDAATDAVSGVIRAGSIREPYGGEWRLSAPVDFAVAPGTVKVEPHQWRAEAATLRVDHLEVVQGLFAAETELDGLPMALANEFLPELLRVEGLADAELRLRQTPEGWNGALAWRQRGTRLRLQPPGEEEIGIEVPRFEAELYLAGTGLAARAVFEAEPGLEGIVEVSMERLAADAAILARLRFSGSEWGWIPAFFPEIDNFEGMIESDISASGSLRAPELRGELRWRQGRLAVPAVNVPLSGIELTVTGSSAGSASISGRAQAGEGTLAVHGRFEDLTQSSRSFTVALEGRQATVLDWPDYRLVVSPELQVAGDLSGIRVTGRIDVDRAEISVSELPEGAVTASPDVSVAGREEEPEDRVPVTGDVQVGLSDEVHVRAFGLDTYVDGQLRLRLPQNREPRAEGELRLSRGFFEAYGQRLEIAEGTMTFVGPPDDPLIFVRATRKIEALSGPVTAGIEMRGRAQNVSSTVFSDPGMPDADALSWLVLGRPLEEATAAEGNALSGTAYALGLRQATAVTSQIGRSLGLDQLSLAGSSQSNTALVAGKQINSHLYVRYAYGVFTQLGNLLMRYRLTRRLTIEAGTGSESQSMDLLYIVEKP